MTQPLSTEWYAALSLGVLGIVFGVAKKLIDKYLDKKEEAFKIDKEQALAEQARLSNLNSAIEISSRVCDEYRKQIDQLLKDKEVDQKAKLDLIEINANLIKANEKLSRDVAELKKEVNHLRLALVKRQIIDADGELEETQNQK